MTTTFLQRVRCVLALTTFGLMAQGCARRDHQDGACASFTRKNTWELAMRSDAAAYTLEGTIETGDHAVRVKLTGTSREGTREPLDYLAESVAVRGDSVHFRFAPIGILVDGRCATEDSVTARFSLPQPPFEPIVGSGLIVRNK
jgi:hypothetical protein